MPIVFAAVLLLAMTVGVSCIWDMWRRAPRIASISPELGPERPQLWDLFIEDPVGSKYDDTVWENLLVSPPGVPCVEDD